MHRYRMEASAKSHDQAIVRSCGWGHHLPQVDGRETPACASVLPGCRPQRPAAISAVFRSRYLCPRRVNLHGRAWVAVIAIVSTLWPSASFAFEQDGLASGMTIAEVRDVMSKDAKIFKFLTGYNNFDLYAVGKGRYVAFCNEKLVEYSKPVTNADDAMKIIDADLKMEQFNREESEGSKRGTSIYTTRYLWKAGSEWVGVHLFAHESINIQNFKNVDQLRRVIDLSSDGFQQLWLSEFNCKKP
jgi:hypothetical protein